MQQSEKGENTKMIVTDLCIFSYWEGAWCWWRAGRQTQKQPPNATSCTWWWWWWWWCWFKHCDWCERWHHWQNQQVAMVLTLIMSVSSDNDASLSVVKLTAKKNFLMRLSSPLEKTKLVLSKTSYENMKHICLWLRETKANNISPCKRCGSMLTWSLLSWHKQTAPDWLVVFR